MQHIIIMGDSWAEPNWRRPQPGFTAMGHTANLLAQRGYTVFNFAESGRGNMTSWLKLERSPPPRIDWIVWFHTEIVRDMNPTDQGPLMQELDRAADRQYSRQRAIYDQWGQDAPIILIEGQSQRHRPQFDDVWQTHTIIADWRAELLGQATLPYTPLLAQFCGTGDPLARWTDSVEDKNRWITEAQQVLDLMHQSPLFLDNAHPGDQAHLALTDRLCQIFAAKR